MKYYNADLFVTDLAKEADSLLTIFDQTDVDSKLNILNDTLQSVLCLHAPVKQIKLRSRPITPLKRSQLIKTTLAHS